MVVTVSADSPQALASFKKKLGLDFILLSDDKSEVISLYGLVHPKGRAGQDIARPATLLIDKEGVIRWTQIPSNYMVRPDPEEVLRELGKL